ncbi:hypothetical protein, partial [Escherichia coli]|uniref:hypothetical protein n=1 Tax=Escherichia coli TaxID=562 RepID=UPI002A35B4A8
FIKSPVLCCGENITFHQVAKFSVPLQYAYSVISRARRYAGMAGVPLPLSLTEINEYLATHPVLIERDEFEAVIFALDDQYFQEQCV